MSERTYRCDRSKDDMLRSGNPIRPEKLYLQRWKLSSKLTQQCIGVGDPETGESLNCKAMTLNVVSNQSLAQPSALSEWDLPRYLSIL